MWCHTWVSFLWATDNFLQLFLLSFSAYAKKAQFQLLDVEMDFTPTALHLSLQGICLYFGRVVFQFTCPQKEKCPFTPFHLLRFNCKRSSYFRYALPQHGHFCMCIGYPWLPTTRFSRREPVCLAGRQRRQVSLGISVCFKCVNPNLAGWILSAHLWMFVLLFVFFPWTCMQFVIHTKTEDSEFLGLCSKLAFIN